MISQNVKDLFRNLKLRETCWKADKLAEDYYHIVDDHKTFCRSESKMHCAKYSHLLFLACLKNTQKYDQQSAHIPPMW